MAHLTRWQKTATFLILFGVLAIYSALAQVYEPWNFKVPPGGHYPLLTESLIVGQTSLVVKPTRQMLGLNDPLNFEENKLLKQVHDASLFQGKYYLYFGVVPAVVFFMPWRMAFGVNAPQGLAVVLFSFGAVLFAAWILLEFWRRFFGEHHFGFYLGSLVFFAFGTGLPIFLTRPAVYEVAISGALFFGMAGLSFILRTVYNSKEKPPYATLAAASLCFGLAVGCRPHTVLFVPILAWAAWCAGKYLSRDHRWVSLLISAFAPWGVVLSALAFYNFTRFGSPFEFGSSFVLNNHKLLAQFSLPRVIGNLYMYLLAEPFFYAKYPYMQLTIPQPPEFLNFIKNWIVADIAGLVFMSPGFFALGFAGIRGIKSSFFLRSESEIKQSSSFIWACLFVGLASFGLLCMYLGIVERYFADFLPYLALGLLPLWWSTMNQRVLRYATVASMAVSVLLSGGLALGGYDATTGIIHRWRGAAPQRMNEMEITNQFMPMQKAGLTAVIETSEGVIRARLYPEKSPRAVGLFKSLAEGAIDWRDGRTQEIRHATPYYDGRLIDKIYPHLGVRFGANPGDSLDGSGVLSQVEWGAQELHHKRGTLMMAGIKEDSMDGLFLISVIPTPWFKDRKVAFGEVIEGMDIVDRMNQMAIDDEGNPQNPLIIKNIRFE